MKSMEIMEIKDIPHAVLKASTSANCFDKITVSSAIDVINPLNIASSMMFIVGQLTSVKTNWKNAIVPKSPIEHPIRHHLVLLADWRQTLLSFQWYSSPSPSTVYPIAFTAPFNKSFEMLSCWTTAVPVSWDTSADKTPVTDRRPSRTLPEHPSQVIPPTEIVIVSTMAIGDNGVLLILVKKSVALGRAGQVQDIISARNLHGRA